MPAQIPVPDLASPHPFVLEASANSNNATVVKYGTGKVHGVQVFNLAAYPVYVKFYDQVKKPIPGTDTAVKSILVPSNVNVGYGAGVVVQWPQGLLFVNGIAFAIVKDQAASGTTVVAAGDCTLNIDYE